MGREFGHYGIDEYLEYATVLVLIGGELGG
ncbi:hypothetical protein [Streptomyces sp. SID3212]